jgi:hypothetical protein
MIRLNTHKDMFSTGLAASLSYYKVPYNRRVGLHLQFFSWRIHLYWLIDK